MAHFAVRSPLEERDLDHDFGPNPVRFPWQIGALREWAFRLLQGIQPRAKVQQEFGREAGADSPGEAEILPFEVANEEGAEANARTSRRCEPTHHQFLRCLAFHFQPAT